MFPKPLNFSGCCSAPKLLILLLLWSPTISYISYYWYIRLSYFFSIHFQKFRHDNVFWKLHMQDCKGTLTLILLTWRIWWAHNNARKWQIGFDSPFKGLNRGSWRNQCLLEYKINDHKKDIFCRLIAF
jgi:hypothetical protein